MKIVLVGLVCLLAACHHDDASDPFIAAANAFAERCQTQKLDAHAAGNDCRILLIESGRALDNAAVESVQYGAGKYEFYAGGADAYADDKRFRAVVYRDDDGGLWTYGATTRDEARDLSICR